MPTPGQIAAALRRFRLVTVNPQPERARNVVGRVIPLLEGRFKVEHVGNIKAEDEVVSTVVALQPDIMFCASSWTPDETTRIIASAKAALPTLRTYAVPHGLHDAGGPDGVAAHLAEQAERLLGEGL